MILYIFCFKDYYTSNYKISMIFKIIYNTLIDKCYLKLLLFNGKSNKKVFYIYFWYIINTKYYIKHLKCCEHSFRTKSIELKVILKHKIFIL